MFIFKGKTFPGRGLPRTDTTKNIPAQMLKSFLTTRPEKKIYISAHVRKFFCLIEKLQCLCTGHLVMGLLIKKDEFCPP